MRLTTRSFVAFPLLLVAACLATPAAAAGPEANAGGHAAGTAAVARFIDNQTIAVARVDFSRLDPRAIEAWLAEVAKAAGPGAADVTKHLGQAREQAEKWLGEFRKAGGRDVYVVMSLADLPPRPALFVVPLAGGANAYALEGLLSAGDPAAPADRRRALQFDRVWNVLLATTDPRVLERARSIKPADRPDLMKALQAGGDAPVAAAAATSADSRRALQELMPTLPQEVGGGPTAVVTRGVTWANLSLRPPPGASLNLVIQSEDPEAAKALGELVDRSLALAAKAAGSGRLQGLDAVFAALKPRAERDQLVLALDDAALRKLAAALLAGPARQAQASARSQVSANNMRQILLVCVMWASDHNGQWPEDVARAAKQYQLPPNVTDNPLKPGTGYTYQKPPAKMENSAKTVVLYEAEASDGMRNVGYADGRVDQLPEEAFQKQLKATNDAAGRK